MFLCPTLGTRTKISFTISLQSSKPTIFLKSIYKHDAINIADPSRMQNACHMNFVMPSPQSLCGSVVERRSAEFGGLGFDSSWGLRIFSLSYARNKMKQNFHYISKLLTKLKETQNHRFDMFEITDSQPIILYVCERMKSHLTKR